MESRTDRLKALISAQTITPLPCRPGIHFDHQELVATLMGLGGLDKATPALRTS